MGTHVPTIVHYSLPTEDLVDPTEIINPVLDRAEAAQDYATQVQNLANNAITELANAGGDTLDQTLFEEISDTLFSIDAAGIGGLALVDPVSPDITAPTISEPDVVVPTAPEMDSSDIDSIIGEVPAFDVVKPSIHIPDLPDDEFPVFGVDAPTVSEIETPVKPEYTLPALPTIADVTIPSPPEYNIASFDGVMPVSDLAAPETMFVYNEAEYSSDIKDKLAEKLYADLVAGGSGLNAETEQAIWDRATARQEAENEAAYKEAHEYHSSRGFNLPEGVLNATLLEVNDRINQRKDDLNNDILVQQSNLAQVNTHFVITQAIGMEKNLMDNSNAVQNRAFEVARAVVMLANETYRIKVEQFIAQLEGYKVQAQVFETKIRAEIAKAEFYKAQIEGIKAGVEVKALLISAYNSQVEGIKTLIQMYATEMEAAKIKADIDRTKLDSYKTQAEVFGIKTDAITSQYNAYQARIAGESEKVRMYTAENQAYVSKVEGYKAGASVEQLKAEVKLAKHQGDIDSFKAILEHYKTKTTKSIAQAEAEVEIEGLKIDQFKADTSKYETTIDALIKNYLGKVEKAKAEGDILIKEREVAVHKLLAEKGITTDMIMAQSKIAAQLAAAALTSVSTSTSMGLSQSQGKTSSSTYSNGYRASISESHHYTHD